MSRLEAPLLAAIRSSTLAAAVKDVFSRTHTMQMTCSSRFTNIHLVAQMVLGETLCGAVMLRRLSIMIMIMFPCATLFFLYR